MLSQTQNNFDPVVRAGPAMVAVGLSRSAFYEAIRRGELAKPIKYGRASRWRQSDLEAFIAAKLADGRRLICPPPQLAKLAKLAASRG